MFWVLLGFQDSSYAVATGNYKNTLAIFWVVAVQFASCDHYPYDSCNLFQVKSEQIITNFLGLCSHESVLFFVLWIKSHRGGFEYKMSFKFLSFSLSLWVILSSFSSSCSVTTWQSFDFYMCAAQTPTAEHARVLSLSSILRFHPVDEFTADAGALQSVQGRLVALRDPH